MSHTASTCSRRYRFPNFPFASNPRTSSRNSPIRGYSGAISARLHRIHLRPMRPRPKRRQLRLNLRQQRHHRLRLQLPRKVNRQRRPLIRHAHPQIIRRNRPQLGHIQMRRNPIPQRLHRPHRLIPSLKRNEELRLQLLPARRRKRQLKVRQPLIPRPHNVHLLGASVRRMSRNRMQLLGRQRRSIRMSQPVPPPLPGPLSA